MKTFYLLAVIYLGAISNPVFAAQNHQSENSGMGMKSSMMEGGKACDKMHKMNPEKMQGMMKMKKEHMQKMETHLANIENLLKQLVELEKKKSSNH